MTLSLPVGYLARVRYLGIENLRRIRQGRLLDIEGSVLAVGANGSGKTTLLEAVYLTSRGRSFRSSKSGPLISKGERRSRIEVSGEGVAGEPIRSEFVAPGERIFGGSGGGRLNVRLVGENSQVLLEGDPGLRRRFLDLNVFHVEPGFSAMRARFERTLAQRNAWLKRGGNGRPVWDQPYIDAAEVYTRARARFLALWTEKVMALGSELPGMSGVRLEWFPGWAVDSSLGTILERGLEADRQHGYTRTGPMRADFWLEIDGERARLSRGQAKSMVAVLQLSARAVEREMSGQPAVWLLDDLAGELDRDAADWVMSQFIGSGDQCFVTAIPSGPIEDYRDSSAFSDLFHVERGTITRL